jgi:preprotein translocase subunit SecD
MNNKIKKIITNVRVIILLVFLVLAVVSISPRPFVDGVAIGNVLTNSSASIAGIQQPSPGTRPVSRERILEINNKPVENVEDYYNFADNLEINQSIQVKTNKRLYILTAKEEFDVIELNETEQKEIEEIVKVNKTINGTLTEVNETIKKIVRVQKTKRISKGVEDVGLRVFEASKTNIRKGLDLQGGTRVLLQPEQILNPSDLGTLMDNMQERLNVYGLTDLILRDASDLSGNQYILVEIAGANENEIRDLLAKEGKFEAKVGNITVFSGGRKDITFVCRSADCAGIDPHQGCSQSGGGFVCPFRFTIALTLEAAQRQADATRDLSVIQHPQGGAYLSEPLRLFLDDTEVDQLNIAESLRGEASTNIQISGSGVGASQQEAVFDALNNMKSLQTVLITGSLPVKLNLVKIDVVSPILGEEFLKNALFVGLLALVSIVVIIFIRYRKLEVAIPMLFISVSELIILLGVAALIGWNIDLAAIAGIIIAIGTGVDHQIVITDETLKGESRMIFNWRERIKSAFFIIMAAYFTLFVAMLPLVFAGAGLLKGFAITTIIGASIGVFISRPVYAKLLEILLRE